jgi:hypothetical protein
VLTAPIPEQSLEANRWVGPHDYYLGLSKGRPYPDRTLLFFDLHSFGGKDFRDFEINVPSR